MTAKALHAHCRGVLIGPAFFFFALVSADGSELQKNIHRQLSHQSYILVEFASQPAQLYVLSPGTKIDPLIYEDSTFRNALLDIVDEDPDVRVDAILELADINADGTIDILWSALFDPSPQVRDAAAAVMEDISDEDRTH